MYLLKQVHDFENCEQIQALFSDLPKRPYCTNAKGFCYIRTKQHAIKHAYIQPNTPFCVRWLVFDVDDPQALFVYHDNHAPRPHLIIKNSKNGHAHYCYRLAEPVGLTGKSSQKAIDYLQAVYFALSELLGADWGYGANLIKNPAHNAWESFTAGQTDPYTLDELAECLKLPTKAEIRKAKQERANDSHFGRNCAVFHATRHQAYRIADKYDYDQLYREILAIATSENTKFDDPMYPNEVRHIAKSITRFCKSTQFGEHNPQFIEKQKQQGRNGAIQANRQSQACNKGGKARSATYDPLREQARQLKEQGLSVRKIAEQLKVSKTSVQKWLKN